MRILVVLILTCAGIASAEKTLKLADLPAAVQSAVRQELKGGEIKNISKETEKGVTQFEVESILNGKHRDFNIDTKGTLVALEEETSLDAIPAAAKDALVKKIADGKLSMVEIVSKSGTTFYEASYVSKGGKKHEFAVTAAGAPVKN